MEDPCGWREDGICDEGCFQFEERFDDSKDCFIDLDNDQLDDNFEFKLAKSFEPYLWFTYREGSRNQRNPYFIVHPLSADEISIFYAISYFRDYGDPELGGLFSHDGDSEFIVLDLRKDIFGEWKVEFIFLSAHYGTSIDSSSWYSGGEFRYYEDDEGNLHPQVYVAEWKHGNYPDASTCEMGGVTADHCASEVGELLGIEADKNLGEPYHHLIDGVMLNGNLEYYWSDLKFCGWQVSSTDPSQRTQCATSYITLINRWLNNNL